MHNNAQPCISQLYIIVINITIIIIHHHHHHHTSNYHINYHPTNTDSSIQTFRYYGHAIRTFGSRYGYHTITQDILTFTVKVVLIFICNVRVVVLKNYETLLFFFVEVYFIVVAVFFF